MSSDEKDSPLATDALWNWGGPHQQPPDFTGLLGVLSGGETEADVLAEAAELGITEQELEREAAELDRLMQPAGFIPGVGPVSGLAMEMLKDFRFFRNPWSDSKCYRISAGMVHVKPGCRC